MSTIGTLYASSGFSVGRHEITSIMQPTVTNYFTGNGNEVNLVLERKPDTTLQNVENIRVYIEGILLPSDYWTYDNSTSYVAPDSSTVSTPNGRIVIDADRTPSSGKKVEVVYYVDPTLYSEHETGAMQRLAMDLCLHPYANDYTTSWSSYAQSISVLNVGPENAGEVTLTLTGGGTFAAADSGKRIREVYGPGIAEITTADGSATATAEIITPFSNTSEYYDSNNSDWTFPAGKWAVVIASSGVDTQPFTLVYPWLDGANSSISTDSNGQQSHTDVMTAIRTIGNLFVVESEKGVDMLSSLTDVNPATTQTPTSLTASATVLQGRKPQKWRIRFFYDETKGYLNVNVGTKYQILDDGTMTRLQGRDGIKSGSTRLPGELSEVYFLPQVANGKAKTGWFRRQGKDGDVTNTYPISYRISTTDHGMSLFMWDHASVDQDDDYAWFVVQRHVNNVSGKPELEDGKSPVHCIYSPSKRPLEASELNSGYYSAYTSNITGGQTSITATDLNSIYDISGRELTTDNPTIVEYITDTNNIDPSLDYGYGINFKTNGTTAPFTLVSGGSTISGNTGGYVNDVIQASGITQSDATPFLTMQTDGTVDEVYGINSTKIKSLTNFSAGKGLGPGEAGLVVSEIYVCVNYTATDRIWQEMREDEHFVILGDGSVRFLHPNSTDKKILGSVTTPTSDLIDFSAVTSYTDFIKAAPEIVFEVVYRWAGGGWKGRYYNPYGTFGDNKSPVSEISKLELLVNKNSVYTAAVPEDYTYDPYGRISFVEAPYISSYAGTSLNSYVYSKSASAVFLRDQLPENTYVTLTYENYSTSETSTPLYLIQIPEDPEYPNSWKDIHRESKGIYRFVVRESDTLKPWDRHVSAIVPQVDSPAIINPMEQISITPNKTFVFNFPTPMVTQRYIYPNAECDLICYSSAGSTTQGTPTYIGTTESPKYDLDSGDASAVAGDPSPTTSTNGDILDHRQVYSWHNNTGAEGTTNHRTYIGMMSTQPNGNGMRVFLLVRGGPISPSYSDYQE